MTPRSASEIAVLPQDARGRTYITDLMIAQDPALGDFLEHTHNSWYRDENQQCYFLYPTAGRC